MKPKQKKSIIFFIGITLTLLISIGIFGFPLLKNQNFGLDLQGGFEVLYEVESIENKEITSEMMTSTYKTIIKRIDILGVSEPEITLEGKNKIRVKLAGVSDEETARRILSTTASLTFRDTEDNLLMTSDVLGSYSGAPVVLKPS